MSIAMILLGAVLVGAGLVVLLHNLGILVWTVGWPIILVTAGIGVFFGGRKDPGGIALAVAGVASVYISHIEQWNVYWPVILILVGAGVVLRQWWQHRLAARS